MTLTFETGFDHELCGQHDNSIYLYIWLFITNDSTVRIHFSFSFTVCWTIKKIK